MKKAVLTLTLALHFSAYAGGDVQAGKALFASRCASCHSVGPSARGAFGPHLNGLIGRHAGATSDYKYSSAMKNSGIVWTEESLGAFLEDPGKFVPGTKMRFWGISDKSRIEDLVTYLRQFQ